MAYLEIICVRTRNCIVCMLLTHLYLEEENKWKLLENNIQELWQKLHWSLVLSHTHLRPPGGLLPSAGSSCCFLTGVEDLASTGGTFWPFCRLCPNFSTWLLLWLIELMTAEREMCWNDRSTVKNTQNSDKDTKQNTVMAIACRICFITQKQADQSHWSHFII